MRLQEEKVFVNTWAPETNFNLYKNLEGKDKKTPNNSFIETKQSSISYMNKQAKLEHHSWQNHI
jgi:hypothetical protein